MFTNADNISPTPDDGDYLTNLMPNHPSGWTSPTWGSKKRIAKVKVGSLWVPPEQRDILFRHRGLDKKLDERLLGTITVLQITDSNGTEKNVLVDGLQRASRVLSTYGPEAEMWALFLDEEDDLAEEDSLWLFEAINQNVQLKPWDYFRSATRSADGKYPGIKRLVSTFKERGFIIGQRNSANVFTAVDALTEFAGLSLRDHSPEASKNEGSKFEFLDTALELISEAWNGQVVSLDQRLNPAVVLGIAMVLCDGVYSDGRRVKYAEVLKALRRTSPGEIVLGADLAKGAFHADGALKTGIKGSTRGGSNRIAYGARYLVCLINGDELSVTMSAGVKVKKRHLSKNRLYLAGDRDLQEKDDSCE